MTEQEIDADLELALHAAARAAQAVRTHLSGELQVRYKRPDQPVTAADLDADRVLHQLLLGERPTYGWLSEETADDEQRLGRRRLWIVDPVDGTSSLVQRRPEFAVCVALVEDGAPVLAVVENPASGVVYNAVRGQGAWADGERLRVRSGTGAVLASPSELERGELDCLGSAWRLLPVGSTACKMAGVAQGTGDAYVARGRKSEWDLCAPALLVEEAGGLVRDLHGRALHFNRPHPVVPGVVAAASPQVLRQILARCSPLPTP